MNMKGKLKEYQKELQNKEDICVKCGRKYYLTVDHIIPQHILHELNLSDHIQNWTENFQIICGACNKIKGGHLDLSNPKTIPLLEKAIEFAKQQLST